jgi:beta-N-acetylhexosaminidase
MKYILAVYFLFLSVQFSAAQQDSLSIKIGQMILIGFPASKVDDNVLRVVKEGKVGSIIMFEKNVPKTNSYQTLKKVLWTYQQAAPFPLFIAIDQEGGLVNRLKEKYGFPRSISAKYMGKNSSLDSVRYYSQSTASTLAGLGINVNFAPDVDVAVNPDNPVIVKKERAFSASEDTVALMAKEVIAAHRRVGVLTALKHFPGHGSSLADTHFGVADVTNTWQDRELTPYRKLCSEGYIDAVMTAHIVNKKLDPRGLPGTLSDSVVNGLLRKKIGFDGVVFSDDLQMEAISKQYSLEETIRLAIVAGVDVLLFCNNVPGSEERKVDTIHEIITKLVKDGVITTQRIDESYKRIQYAKRTLTQNRSDSLAELMKLKFENERLREKLTTSVSVKGKNEDTAVKPIEDASGNSTTGNKKSKKKTKNKK